MSESNQPYGGSSGQPGGGYPGQPGPYGAGEQQPAWPQVPTPGAPISSGPPTSAGSAAPGPWSASAPSASAAPAGGSAAQNLSTAQVGETLTKIGIGNPLPTFVIGAAAYIVGLLASLLVIASAFVAALTADTGDLSGGMTDPTGGGATPSSGGGGGFETIVGLLGLPFQLVSLASFGSYDVEVGLGFLGSLTMSWRGLPLLTTIAMVFAGFVGARLVQRRWSSNGVLGAALWSGISGLTVAVVAVVVVRLTAFSVEDYSTGVSISMHSAGADMFFGTWVLIGVPLFLGHMAGLTKPAWWPLVADLAAAPRLVIAHALAFALPVGIIGLIGGAIALAVDGDGQSVLTLLLALPVWGPTALAFLPGMGMLVVPVSLYVQGDVETFGIQDNGRYYWFFDLPWYVWVPMVLIALVVPLLIAVLWNRDRQIEKGNVLGLIASWAALPIAYTVGSIILLALVWTSAQAQMGMMGSLVFHAGLAIWMPVIAFLIGAVVEVISRFGAPFVDRFVPGFLVNWFRRSARARRAEQTAPEGPTPPAQAPGAPFFPGV